MITLDLPIQTEQMIIRSAAELGISIEEYVILKLTPETLTQHKHNNWQEFFAFRDKLLAEEPEVLENFNLERDLSPPQVRALLDEV